MPGNLGVKKRNWENILYHNYIKWNPYFLKNCSKIKDGDDAAKNCSHPSLTGPPVSNKNHISKFATQKNSRYKMSINSAVAKFSRDIGN